MANTDLINEGLLSSYHDELMTDEIIPLKQEKADKDGYYQDMTVGNSLNILSEDVVTEQTTLGVTAPDSEIGRAHV